MAVNLRLIVCVAAIVVGVLTWFGVVPVTPHHATGLVETTLGILGLV